MDKVLEYIKESFNGRISIKEKRPGIYQIMLPIYHEDGDMIDLFISQSSDNEYLLSDFGLTLQRLAYSYDIDTPNKELILQKMLSENRLTEESGNIFFKTKAENLYAAILHITHVYSKIGSMRFFKREVIQNLFFEMLDEFIFHDLNDFNPQRKPMPIPEKDEFEADYSFQPNGKPIYLFGVTDSNQAKLATISCQQYLISNIKYHGWVVTENFEALTRKDRNRLLNVSDKQFTSFDEFKINARIFLEKERT